MNTDKQYPIGGYAPGRYMCICATCKQQFMGDKRAVQCEPCALEMVEESAHQPIGGHYPNHIKNKTMDAVKVLENHFGSDFYRIRISGDFHHILNAMEEYANLKAREAAEKAWDTSRKATIEDICIEYDEVRDMEFIEVDYSSIQKSKEKYINEHYPLHTTT